MGKNPTNEALCKTFPLEIASVEVYWCSVHSMVLWLQYYKHKLIRNVDNLP